MLTYSLAVITTYLALAAGMILAFMTEEELKAGRRYFEIVKHVCLISVSVILIHHFAIDKAFPELAASILLLAVLGSQCARPSKFKYEIVYAVLAGMFYLSSKNPNMLMINSVFILIYGIPAGTTLTGPKKKLESFKRILRLGFYPVLAIILKLVLA